MTEREAFTEMLTRAGVAYNVEDHMDGEGADVVIEHYGFFARFTFDVHGALECVGMWE